MMLNWDAIEQELSQYGNAKGKVKYSALERWLIEIEPGSFPWVAMYILLRALSWLVLAVAVSAAVCWAWQIIVR